MLLKPPIKFLLGTVLIDTRFVGEELNLETLNNLLYRGMVDTLEATPVDSTAYQAAVLAYFDSLIRQQEERLDSLSRWLLGENTSPADTKILREVGVTGKINRPNAFRMLRSLCPVIRALSYSGLILLFDEVDRMASVGGKAEKLATDTLREVVDRTREDCPARCLSMPCRRSSLTTLCPNILLCSSGARSRPF